VELPSLESLPQAASVLTALRDPFADDVCASALLVSEASSVAHLNEGLVDQLCKALEGLTAQQREDHVGCPLTLLTAPRAGYGKTHLLGRVAARTEQRTLALLLTLRPDMDLTWPVVSRELLEGLQHLPSEQAGWSKLRELTAGIFVSFVVKLIEEGRLPCANKEQAVEVLSARPAELFEEGSAANLIGEWLKRHFNALRKPLSDTARRVPSITDAEAWIEALFSHASLGTHTSGGTLIDLICSSRQSFLQFLRLLAQWRPVFLLVDHLDSFYRQRQAGLKMAHMLLELSEVPSVYPVLSMNEDLWQATFAHHLPSALEDRLTASQLFLQGLPQQEAHSLLTLRLESAAVPAPWADCFTEYLSLDAYYSSQKGGAVSARSFLRHAASRWKQFVNLLKEGKNPLKTVEVPVQKMAVSTDSSVFSVQTEMEPPFPTLSQPAALPSPQQPAPPVAEAVQVVPQTPAPQWPSPPQYAPPFPQAPAAQPLAPLPAVEAVSQMAETTPFSLIQGPASDFLEMQPPQQQPTAAVAPAISGPFAIPQPPAAPAAAAYVQQFSQPSAPLSAEGEPQTPFAMVFRPESAPAKAPEQSVHYPQAPAQPSLAPQSGSPSVAPGAVERLKEMMERLKQRTGPLHAPQALQPQPPSAEFQAPTPTAAPAPAPVISSATPPQPPLMAGSSSPEGLLAGRFEALRMQTANEAQHRPLDRQKMRDLIRLAGRRFPLVKYDEVPLVTQPGQTVPRWTLQGLEVFFGLGDFMDKAYWKATGDIVAARNKALEQADSATRPQVKLIALKSDRDTLAWSTLLNGAVLPAEISPRTEGLHLDARSISALYAMQRIIAEAESGAIETTPVQVMSVLARELDFFWKRVTRPL
jgi:hypothetical protein